MCINLCFFVYLKFLVFMKNILTFINKKYTWFSFLLSIIVAIIFILNNPSIVYGQFSLSNGNQSSLKPPKGVTRYGAIEVAVVKSPLDGTELFQIVSTTIFDRANINEVTEEKLPVEIRAEEITSNLERAFLGRIKNVKTLKLSVSILNNQPIIQISDADTSRPLKLVTITELDADFHGKTPEELSIEWTDILQKELDKLVDFFDREHLIVRLKKLTYIVFITLIVSGFLWLSKKVLDRQINKLKNKSKLLDNNTQTLDMFNSSEGEVLANIRFKFLSQLKNKFTFEKQLNFYYFWRWLLFWLQILVWYGGTLWFVSVTPVLMKYQDWLLDSPVLILFIIFIYSSLIKLSHWIIDFVLKTWKKTEFISLGENERKEMRTNTISQAIKGFFSVLFSSYAITEVLDVFGFSTTSIIAGGAVVALGVSFGTQNLVKDLINGFLILLEDQYAVGDFIDLGICKGLVENLNLRVTQIRDEMGSLVTIPNSSIVLVKNLTRNWSRVNFTIEIDYFADIDLALQLLKDISISFFNEPEWQKKIIEMPQVLGIDNVSNNGLSIKIWITTLPLEQWSVEREFRYRVYKIFAENQISIAIPVYTYINKNEI